MASTYQRKPGGKWYASYKDVDGKYRARAGYTDRKKTQALADRLETEAAMVRDGLLPPAELTRRSASRRPVAEHVEDYRLYLLDKGGGAKHAAQVAGALIRLFGLAEVRLLADLKADRVQSALARVRAMRSPRTTNHALGCAQAFANWLAAVQRIEASPLGSLSRFSEAVDRAHVRRALSRAEMDRLLDAAEAGEPVRLSRRGCQYGERWISGPERAWLYRLAMETGFRANELRHLCRNRGWFRLGGAEPTVWLAPDVTKNGLEVVQPIRREFAAALGEWLPAVPEGRPLIDVPIKTAQLLRRDLAAAGIPYADAAGRVVDFHALRSSFITDLIRSGVNPKVVQKLARHSTITLTLDLYTHLDGGDLRQALESGGASGRVDGG